MVQTLAAGVVVAAAVVGCGSAPGSPGAAVSALPLRLSVFQPARGDGPPPQFVSLRFTPKRQRGSGPEGFLEVAVSDSRTGAIIQRLLPASTDGMAVTGLSLDRSGDVWITYSRGPGYRDDTAGGDPRPYSCGNEIVILHTGTGRATVFLRTDDNALISGAAPSPDGGLLAYSESGCATGYFNS